MFGLRIEDLGFRIYERWSMPASEYLRCVRRSLDPRVPAAREAYTPALGYSRDQRRDPYKGP